MNKVYHKTSRVRVFIDYWNFANNWNSFTGHFPDKNMDWAALPRAILEALHDIPQLSNTNKDLRGVKVYASSLPMAISNDLGFDEEERLKEDLRLSDWLEHELDQLTAYTVDITQRSDRPLRCDVCKTENSHFVEQGVDTKIAIDLVSLASSDLYDIAVLITDDGDLVPSTQCVQDTLDKQVVHIGFKDLKTEVRKEAWGHLYFDSLLADIVRT